MSKTINRKFDIIKLIFILSILMFIVSIFQPKSGKHSWLLEFAGDWSIAVGSNSYVICPAIDASRYEQYRCYQLCRWVNADMPENFARERFASIIDGIEKYNSDDQWIVIKTVSVSSIKVEKGVISIPSIFDDEEIINYFFQKPVWIWINTIDNTLQYAANDEQFSAEAPDTVKQLSAEIHEPSQSLRWRLIELGGFFMVIVFIAKLIRMSSKGKSKSVKGAPQSITPDSIN